MAQYSAATEAADAQNQYYMQNAREAQRAAVDSYTSQNIRLRQEKEAADQKRFEDSIEALKRRGTAYTSAGEAGVSGLSVDALVGDIFAQEGRQAIAVTSQFQANRQNILSEMDETRARAQGRINSVQRANYPSAASYIISGLSGAVRGLSGGYSSSMAIS